jgi:hypothetical protein
MKIIPATVILLMAITLVIAYYSPKPKPTISAIIYQQETTAKPIAVYRFTIGNPTHEDIMNPDNWIIEPIDTRKQTRYCAIQLGNP